MKLYVGITDNSWFRFLAGLPDVDEVNFWQPSGGRTFRALQPGDPWWVERCGQDLDKV